MAHILIVDDDAPSRETLRYILEEAGDYQFIEAADGVEGLELIRASETPLVVLLDPLIPKLNGLDLLQAVASDARLAARDAYIIYTLNSRITRANIPQGMGPQVEIITGPFDTEDFAVLVARGVRRIHRVDDGLDDILERMLDDE